MFKNINRKNCALNKFFFYLKFQDKERKFSKQIVKLEEKSKNKNLTTISERLNFKFIKY